MNVLMKIGFSRQPKHEISRANMVLDIMNSFKICNCLIVTPEQMEEYNDVIKEVSSIVQTEEYWIQNGQWLDQDSSDLLINYSILNNQYRRIEVLCASGIFPTSCHIKKKHYDSLKLLIRQDLWQPAPLRVDY